MSSLAQSTPLAGSTRRATARWLVGSAIAAALLLAALPSLSGVDWATIGATLLSVPPSILVLLTVLWALGLLSHTITLTAALPQLTHRRALTLSLTGSAVANVLPMGGAAGVALNYRMIRGWGFSRSQFSAYTLVSNLWDVLVKMVAPVLVVPLVVASGLALPSSVQTPALVAAVMLAVLCGLAAVLVVSRRAAELVGAALDRALSLVPLLRHRMEQRRMRRALVDLHRTCNDVVRHGWMRLTGGMLLYTALLFALLSACLWVTGAGLGLAALAVGFAVERLLTLAGLTPGGAGFVEVGLTGALLALGGDPVGTVSGVLLYRLLTFLLEIPVGGVWFLGWWWKRRADVPAVEEREVIPSMEEAA